MCNQCEVMLNMPTKTVEQLEHEVYAWMWQAHYLAEQCALLQQRLDVWENTTDGR